MRGKTGKNIGRKVLIVFSVNLPSSVAHICKYVVLVHESALIHELKVNTKLIVFAIFFSISETENWMLWICTFQASTHRQIFGWFDEIEIVAIHTCILFSSSVSLVDEWMSSQMFGSFIRFGEVGGGWMGGGGGHAMLECNVTCRDNCKKWNERCVRVMVQLSKCFAFCGKCCKIGVCSFAETLYAAGHRHRAPARARACWQHERHWREFIIILSHENLLNFKFNKEHCTENGERQQLQIKS